MVDDGGLAILRSQSCGNEGTANAQLETSRCLVRALERAGSLTAAEGFNPVYDQFGGVQLAAPAASSTAPGWNENSTAVIASVGLGVVRLASAAGSHPIVGAAARRWLVPPPRMARREKDATPRERRLSALASALWADAFCTDPESLSPVTALHVLSMPIDSPVEWGAVAAPAAEGTVVRTASSPVLAMLPSAASRIAPASAASVLRDSLGPLHRPWQMATGSGLSRLLEPLADPPAAGGKTSCPPLDNPGGAGGILSPRAAKEEARTRRRAALAWAWAMVESRAFDVSLPGDGKAESAGVQVITMDAKDRAKQRQAKAKAEAEARAKDGKARRIKRKGGKGKDANATLAAEAKAAKAKAAKDKAAEAKAAKDKAAKALLSDNALVPLMDLANTPPHGCGPVPDAEAAPGAVPAALVASGLAVELDRPAGVWPAPSEERLIGPTPGGFAGRGKELAARGTARAWVTMRVSPWRRLEGSPPEGAAADAAGAGSGAAAPTPVWLSYGGDPRLAEAKLLRDSSGRRTKRRRPAGSSLGTGAASSDGVSPAGSLGPLLAGSRCSQEWWSHYGFVPGADGGSLDTARRELTEALIGTRRAAQLAMEAGAVAAPAVIAKREAELERSRTPAARRRRAKGVTSVAEATNATLLADALLRLDKARRRATRAAAGSVWARVVRPPADCAAVRLYTKHELSDEDMKSDAEPSKHSLGPKTALLRVTGVLPSLMVGGRMGEYTVPPRRSTVDVTAIVRAPAPPLLARLYTGLVARLSDGNGTVADATAEAVAWAAENASSTVPQHVSPPARPVAPVPPGLLQAAAVLSATVDDVEDVGGPLAMTSLLDIPVLDAAAAKRLTGPKTKRRRGKPGAAGREATRSGITVQGRMGSMSDLRALRATIEERAAISVRGLVTSTRDGAVAALRGLASFPSPISPGSGSAMVDPSDIGLSGPPPPLASLGAAVSLRLAGFSVLPAAVPTAAAAKDDGSDDSSDGDDVITAEVDASAEAALTAPSPADLGLGDDRGGILPDFARPDPALGGATLADAELLLPADVRATAHAHASALRALAAAAEGAAEEAEAAVEEAMAASETRYNPSRRD